MMLFLDTEWSETMPDGTQFVSLGLVGLDEQYMFYAERDPLPTPNYFVHAVVYPLLNRGKAAMPDAVLAHGLRSFTAHVAEATGERPTIAYDYWMDRSLFLDVWAGLDTIDRYNVGQPDVGWFDLCRLNPHYTTGQEGHFSTDPEARRTRHHALTDAYAARAGYLFAIRVLGDVP